MKYVVVYWIETNETSVMEDSSVRDAAMLSNPKRVGMVYHKEIGRRAPKGGWKAFAGRVISVHDTAKEARKAEAEFIMQDKENALPEEAIKKRKRDDFFASDDESDRHDQTQQASDPKAKASDIARRRKMAEKESYKSLLPSSSEDDNEDDDDDVDLNSYSKQELVNMVKSLHRKLQKERTKSNLCKELPEMLIQALTDCRVVEKFKGCSTSKKVIPFRMNNLNLTTHTDLNKSNSYGNSVRKVADSPVLVTPHKPSPNNHPIPAERQTPIRAETPVHANAETPVPVLTCRQTTTPAETPVRTPTPVRTAAINSTNYAEVICGNEAEMTKDKVFDTRQINDFLTPNAKREVDRSKNFSKMTKNLLAALFSRETLQKSSLAGKKKDGGEVLDGSKVELIIDYVMQSFPSTTRAAIRNAITQKIKDERAACRRMMQVDTASHEQINDKEN